MALIPNNTTKKKIENKNEKRKKEKGEKDWGDIVDIAEIGVIPKFARCEPKVNKNLFALIARTIKAPYKLFLKLSLRLSPF